MMMTDMNHMIANNDVLAAIERSSSFDDSSHSSIKRADYPEKPVRRRSINRSSTLPNKQTMSLNKFMMEEDLMDASCGSSSYATLPTLAYSVSQGSCITYCENEEDGDEDDFFPVTVELTQRAVAAVKVQTVIRGALARWNFRVVKLQAKLVDIQTLKDKQIKKIEERKNQTMKAAREECEYKEEHRVVRRRLRRVKTLRNVYTKAKQVALAKNQKIRAHCQQLAQQNDECAVMLQTYIQQMEIGQRNQTILKANQRYLQNTCRTYETILEEFQLATQLS